MPDPLENFEQRMEQSVEDFTVVVVPNTEVVEGRLALDPDSLLFFSDEEEALTNISTELTEEEQKAMDDLIEGVGEKVSEEGTLEELENIEEEEDDLTEEILSTQGFKQINLSE